MSGRPLMLLNQFQIIQISFFILLLSSVLLVFHHGNSKSHGKRTSFKCFRRYKYK